MLEGGFNLLHTCMQCVRKNAGARIVELHYAGGQPTTRTHAGILCVSECGARQAIVLFFSHV